MLTAFGAVVPCRKPRNPKGLAMTPGRGRAKCCGCHVFVIEMSKAGIGEGIHGPREHRPSCCLGVFQAEAPGGVSPRRGLHNDFACSGGVLAQTRNRSHL